MATRRTHSLEFKQSAVEASEQTGASIAGVAMAHGINANQLHKWRRTLIGPGRQPAGSSSSLIPVTVIRKNHQGRRILIVDDELLNLEVAKFLLEDIGLVVDTAEDGLQAVDKAIEQSYALILMDMQMPNLNGFKATQQIRELPAHRETPILAMTTNVFVEDRVRCLEAGMNDFLAKQFNPDLLFSTLLKWLERRSNYSDGRPDWNARIGD